MLEQYVPSAAEPFNYQYAGHLLRRVMIGPKDEEIRRAVEEGYEKTRERIFTLYEPSTEHINDYAGHEPHIKPPPPGPEFDIWFAGHVRRIRRFAQWWFLNMLNTEVSLSEKMILFWHRHFAIGTFMYAEYQYVHNTVLRKNSLGNFKQMIKAQTQDILMQLNLGLHENFFIWGVPFINENYARELMELYTCGVFDDDGNRNYTQQDVHEAARALTGWYYAVSKGGEEYASLYSNHELGRWDPGTKTYLGKTGAWNSFDIIDILFEQRAQPIALRMARKIYKAFVRDIPDEQVVKQLAQTLRDNDWEIEPVMRELLGSKHFFEASSMGVMKKSHIEYVMGMVRQLGLTDIPDLKAGQQPTDDLLQRLERWGELMHAPATVAGWTGGRDWVNSSILPRRIQFALDVMNEQVYPILHPKPPAIYLFQSIGFAERFPENPNLREFVEVLIRYLLPVDIAEEETADIVQAIIDGGTEFEWDIHNPALRADARLRKCLSRILMHPSFQLY